MAESKFSKTLIIVFVFFVLGFSIFAFIKNSYSAEKKLPESARQNPKVKEAYLFARNHPEILEKIPCFCGCANLEHKSNLDCFLDEKGGYVSHGSLCGGCVGVALDVKKLYLQNKPVGDIRSFIDSKYGSQPAAFATPTPEVE